MTTGDKIDTKDRGEIVERVDKVGTREAETPQEVLARLQQEAAALDRQNLDAVMVLIKRHEDLLRDKSTPDLLKREIVANLMPLRTARKELKASLEAEAPPPESEKPKEVELDQRLHDESIFPQVDREAFLVAFGNLPDEFKHQFAERLSRALKQKDEASTITALRGATFEMSRMNTITRQGLEETVKAIPTVYLQYTGYSRRENDFSQPPQLLKKGRGKGAKDPIIDFDVPIVRGGRPYLYEAKNYPRKAYGYDVQAYNQALKYQAAIEQGLVDGATIELRGRIDRKFMTWSFGLAIGAEGHIPDVEMVYNVELPSGKEFRIPIKRAENGNALKFENEEQFDESDQIYVRTLERLRGDSHAIIELVTAIHVNADDASDELRPFLEDPSKITTRELFDEYDRLRKEGLLRMIERKADEYKVNTENQHSAVEYAEMDPEKRRREIKQLVLDYQLHLQQNPQEAAVKRHYVLREEDYELAFDRVNEMLAKVATFETQRAADPEEAVRQSRRVEMGYLGRPEGVALDAHHVMFDAVYGINKESIDVSRTNGILGAEDLDMFFEQVREGKIKSRFRTEEEFDRALEENSDMNGAYERIGRKKQGKLRKLIKEAQFVRSYEWPERFLTSETLNDHLENADRYTLDIYILDPTKKIDPKTGEPRPHKQESTTVVDVEKTEVGIVTENIKRAEAYIKGTARERSYKREVTKIKIGIGRLKKEQGERTKEAQIEAKQEGKRIGSEMKNLNIRKGKLSAEASKLEPGNVRLAEIEAELADTQENLTRLQEARTNLFSKVRAISAEYQPRIVELNRNLEAVYEKAIPEEEWDTFAIRISGKTETNEMKTIYFINAEGEVIIQEEIIRGDVTGRAAHSELGKGRNGYGMGELKFEKRTEAGEIVRPGEEGEWVLVEYNNGSGHYRPDSNTSLPYVFHILKERGIDTSKAKPFDAILRGRPIRDML